MVQSMVLEVVESISEGAESANVAFSEGKKGSE